MSNRIPINPIGEIAFGKTLLASELECFVAYAVYCFGENGYMAPTTHLLFKYLTDMKAVFARISSPSVPIHSTTNVATADVAFRNIARLARLTLEGDSLAFMLTKLSDELAMLPNGVVCTTKTISNLYTDVVLYVVGGNMKEFIGEWDNQKWAVQDEIIGGIFITLFYVCTLWGLHLGSVNMLLHSTGEFTKEGATMHGNYKPLIPSDPKTWGSVLVAQENSTASSVFGMSTAYLDDPVLRAITVVKVDGVEKLMNRLLTPSRWTWRFGRWVQIQPVYFLWCPETSDDGAIFSDWSSKVMLMINTTDENQWRTFNNTLNEFVADLKAFYFKNKSYATLKAMFNFVPFGEFPVPAPTGNGGMLFHQMAYFEDGGAGSTDQLYHKFLLDTDDAGHLNLQTRRNFNEDKRFLMIGDLEVEDYLIQVAAMVSKVWYAGAATSLGVNVPWLSLKSYFGFGVGKTEDEDYKIGRIICDGVAVVNAATALHNTAAALIGDNLMSAHPKWTLYTNSDDLTFPISLLRSKDLFKYGRSADPYKKLKHVVVDINELDIDNVLKAIRKYFWPIGTSSIISTPIPVSAFPEANPEQKLVSDDVNSKRETVIGTDIPVSAKIDDLKAQVKKEEKKIKEEKKEDKK